MRKLRMFAVFCLVAVLLGGIGVYANTNFGSESDPLITLSYLNSVLKPELEQKYSQQTQNAIAELESRIDEGMSGSYTALTVKANPTVIFRRLKDLILSLLRHSTKRLRFRKVTT